MKFFNRPVKPEDTDDEQLLNSYRATRDLKLLGKLYERYMPLVYGVALKYLKEEEPAQDAVMAIFEELAQKVHQHDVKQFRSWLYVFSRNHCLMQLRAGKKMETVGLDEFMEFTPVLHPDTESREEAMQALERCLDKLTVPQKQSVRLFYLDEKCYKDVADETGYTLNEVKSYIQNGKRNLKICLEKNSGQ
ncbi:RNA polymerase sigma factor [Mucilaginibacter phyllosphaerae]|uniref:RNA polymerase sigma-70 factor (ECF subfamily) n=1 Tax=Mucilaginibacter phyllosphaerae TaxID=1812349 RepID=A0A4Y8AA98_9SPHI|nr:sigma-70 family RNA polymerase sigma factor [Mucilaginibacter phyllosphaerae]MBB3969977.1 RNA polymerase sigma-70 factor (ECF subfamily) [Mucilaginibacter phyllosphaerae]TEW65346.1 sigma-70 family RNA polymerase sigma factor [Mucilaginibacter phyllosphaerae]GGH16461.1 DNA-directed RNA polymerase sigma-70 factor [Mucilaginibacter phyllosphaerae]